MKIGIALGAGGARGFYHIGVLKAFEKLKIKISFISGTSIGALIGGFYALYPNAKYIEKKIIDKFQEHEKIMKSLKVFSAPSNIEEKKLFLEKSFDLVREIYLWNLRIIKPYLIESRPFLKIYRELFKTYRFSDCKIHFVATSVDLVSAQECILSEGPLYRAVLASSAVPGFFPPLRWDDKMLVDGGVLVPVPSKIINRRKYFVVGVNLEYLEKIDSQVKNTIDILFLIDRIRYRKILNDNVSHLDFLLSTKNLENIAWPDFDRSKELVKMGEEETLARGDDLLKAMKKARFKKFFFL